MSRPDTTIAGSRGVSAGLAAPSDYVALVKPRVVLMILLTMLVGFLMGTPAGSPGVDYLLLARALFGMALVSGGTLALNQYFERDIDARMARTRCRPLPGGRMRPVEALAFGAGLTLAGLLFLTIAVTPLCGTVTAATVISYLFLYTPLKTRSPICTLVGAFPGALPPVSGWVAAGGGLDASAAVLFGILFFWQLPHSLAIGRIYLEDYRRAGVRLLPTVDPDGGSTGRQVVLSGLALLAVSLLPTIIGLTGWVYFPVALAMGALMLWHGVALALTGSVRRARRLLAASYIFVPVVMLAMAADRAV